MVGSRPSRFDVLLYDLNSTDFKHDLAMRPIYRSSERRNEANIFVGFLDPGRC